MRYIYYGEEGSKENIRWKKVRKQKSAFIRVSLIRIGHPLLYAILSMRLFT